MWEAIAEARIAESAGEVPVGAVLVRDGLIVARGHNRPISTCDPTAHAEIEVLRTAAQKLRNYRLDECDLYVTLEPCIMCAGAIVHARVRRLIFGARDLRFGGIRSKFQLADTDLLNHQVEIVEGVLGSECTALLQSFFQRRR